MPRLPEDLERLLHDLRGPLNSAVVHLEVLRRTMTAERVGQQALETIHTELLRLADMLPAAFGVVAIERGDLRPLDLRSVTERALAEHGLRGVTVAPAPWPDVLGDDSLLVPAIAHLVRNAIEATEEASGERRPAEVSAERVDGDVEVRVRDWGRGFPNPRVRPRALTSKKAGHRGVGLVLVERVARLHGGGLRIEPRPDGTDVRLVLPAKR